MLKTKDFYLLKVYNLEGKYLGIIDDIYIDFYNGIIKGLVYQIIFYLVKRFSLR